MAPRSRSGTPAASSQVSGTVRVPPPSGDPVVALARRWADLGRRDDAAVVTHLATVLRRLSAALRAEPFWPLATRDLGVELLDCGLCDGDAEQAEDLIVPSLRLLRESGPGVLCPAGPDGERRLAAALDEVVAGYVGALHAQHRHEGLRFGRPQRVPRDARVPALDEAHVRAVYLQSAVGIAVVGLDGMVVDLNPALCAMLGMSWPPTRPRPMSDLIHPEDMLEVVERFPRLVRGEPAVVRMELRLVRADSGVVWVHIVGSRVLDDDGEVTSLMGVVEDVSQRHGLQSRLAEATHRDQLARLPGHALAEQWLRRAFAPDGAVRVGVCALDIDGFPQIRDDLGPHDADRLLLGVAGRLQMAAGEHLVARADGDGFLVLMADPPSGADVRRMADRLQDALAAPFHLDGRLHAVSASIGVAEARTDRGYSSEVLRAADTARSWAKALGGARRVVFDPERDAAEAARFALVSGLPGAIGRDEFRLAYQPLVGLADGRVQGVEALVRWQHPEQGLIGPGCFIQLAEHSGAIVGLGRWVLEAACGQAAAWWRELGPQAPYVSVNVSPVQLAEPGWLQEVTDVLAATGLPPQMLQLEITEQAVLGEQAAILDALAALRATGVRLALDDFGTGYSSLVWLRRLPVHVLKIDGSFIDGLRNADPDPTDTSIVQALIGMAHALNLEVTAEWVETEVQAERLAALGCDAGQGRWFGDAGPGEWVPELWRRSIGS